jgi:hypothetical protein
MKTRRIVAIVGALLVSSCTQTRAANPSMPGAGVPELAAVAQETPRSPHVSSEHETPLDVSWQRRASTQVVANGPSRIVELTARIEHRGRIQLPLAVSVRVPPGVQIARGPAQYTVPAAGAGTVTETEFDFVSVDPAALAGDITLVVDGQEISFGVHAEAIYQLAPAAVVGASQGPTEPHTILGGVDLGPSAPIR